MQTGWYMEESQSRAGGQGDVWATTQYSGFVILPYGMISFQSGMLSLIRLEFPRLVSRPNSNLASNDSSRDWNHSNWNDLLPKLVGYTSTPRSTVVTVIMKQNCRGKAYQ